MNGTMATSKGTAAKQEAKRAAKPTQGRGRGRPRKLVVKEDSIHIRLTAEQKERLSAEAERIGSSLSTWLLGLGLREVEAREVQRAKAEGGAGPA